MSLSLLLDNQRHDRGGKWRRGTGSPADPPAATVLVERGETRFERRHRGDVWREPGGLPPLKLGTDARGSLETGAPPNFARTAAAADALRRLFRKCRPHDLIGDLVAAGQAQVGAADAGRER